jgi:glutamine cyclotransferase
MGPLRSIAGISLCLLIGCGHKEPPPAPASLFSTEQFADFQLVGVFPHDPEAFTQGLVSRRGRLYESTGLYGKSSLRQVALSSGGLLANVEVPHTYFAEGLTDWGNRLYQLTWKQGRCFVYNADSLELVTEHVYEGEGWGLTQDGRRLILSDGTDTLRFIDPESFTVQETLKVTRNGRPQGWLNELEYIEGRILANVWQSDQIVAIDPATGKILQEYDLSPLRARLPLTSKAEVLNGIARHPAKDTLLVTGKWWPNLFEIRLREGGD